MTNILKQTKSLCPTCLTEIDATVVEENNNVYMIKECMQHGKFKALVEKDVEFYKKTMNKYSLNKKHRIINEFLIPFTHKCNQNCNFCWVPERNREDFTLNNLKKIISNSDYKMLRICGGEPTLRKDLLEFIRFIKKNKKFSVLTTNGIALTNLGYVKKLKEAGLNLVCLSFNSFSDVAYKKLNGRKLLQIKLKALENLKKVGINTSISVMVVKGLNDKELKKIFDYCIENNSFIKELRIRSYAPFGRYIKSQTFFVSEMIVAFSKILNIDKKAFLKVIDKKEHKPCYFSALLVSYKEDNKYTWLLIKKIVKHQKIIFKIRTFIEILLRYKINKFLRLITNKINGKNNLVLFLEFRTWPNKHNFDFIDMERCNTHQLCMRGERISACYAAILNNENLLEI